MLLQHFCVGPRGQDNHQRHRRNHHQERCQRNDPAFNRQVTKKGKSLILGKDFEPSNFEMRQHLCHRLLASRNSHPT